MKLPIGPLPGIHNRRPFFLPLLAGLVLLTHGLQAQEKTKKALPLPGDSFLIGKHEAFVIAPPAADPKLPVPWVWYAPTLPGLPGTAEKWMFEQFLAAGIAIAGIDAGESYGSPRGNAVFTSLYRELTEKRGFAKKPVFLGRSRGGLMALSWAAENAGSVGGFAGIYPVCDLASYPGISKACGAFDLTADALQSRLKEFNPVERLESIAKAGVPLFAIHGDSDRLVPLDANSGEVQKRYLKLGGAMQLIVPKNQGHNMWQGFFQCGELVAFIKANARP